MGNLTNSENAEEMQSTAAFQQDLHCCKGKKDPQIEEYNTF